MLNIFNYQGNANQHHNENYSTPPGRAIIKQITSVVENVDKLEPHALLVGMRNGLLLWRTAGRSSNVVWALVSSAVFPTMPLPPFFVSPTNVLQSFSCWYFPPIHFAVIGLYF